MKNPLLLLLATLLGSQAFASSDQAWKEHDARLLSACKAVSSLKDVRPAGQPVLFDDRLGLTALVLEGRYPQPHMKNQRGRELCLFERKSRKAHIAEADALLDARKP
ncbi:hypothetical protein DM872_09460 [Pseudomonas taiwanensis]|uniref:hypothetical protein n=1 Tax=Pseudomonas taiwanensis TaxID=470150 RepID=UPI0015C09373|nr:hypothetical protein [Pseudomonas taiwanensis]NWL77079.1 hypothetical protein [Pseudomonas taiwanensis]